LLSALREYYGLGSMIGYLALKERYMFDYCQTDAFQCFASFIEDEKLFKAHVSAKASSILAYEIGELPTFVVEAVDSASKSFCKLHIEVDLQHFDRFCLPN
jgi:hypothetical protein